MKVSKEERDQAVAAIKNVLFKTDTIYGIVRSVARSGMSRTIDFYVIHEDRPIYLSGYMSKILGMPRTKEGALKVAGCGMNMIFACVDALSRSLGDNSYSLKHEQL